MNPYLTTHYAQLSPQAEDRVLVPLCGKSLDMLWLREQGHTVVGVELSELACEAFFTEQGAEYQLTESPVGKHFSCDGIELICADLFTVGERDWGKIDLVYDRAALVALPQSMRQAYAEHLIQALPIGVRILLVTLEFDDEIGPPFAVPEAEVHQLYGERFEIARVGETDISDDKFPGRFEAVYLLQDRA